MRKIITVVFCSLLSVCLFAQNWDQLSEVEKYAVAFSSNLFELNKENHFDFSNQSEAEEGKQILKDSWGITDYESLIENFKRVQLLYKQEPSEQVLTSLESLEKEFPACKGITFYWHLDLLRKFSDSKNVVNYIEENSEYWTSLPSENGISVNTKFAYMYALNDINQPQKAIEVFETLPDSVKMNVYVYYQYACSYYILAVQAPVDAERFVYEARAVNAFKQCEKMGLQLNDYVKNWIESVQ